MSKCVANFWVFCEMIFDSEVPILPLKSESKISRILRRLVEALFAAETLRII